MRKKLNLVFLFLIVSVTIVQAQNCDPWITDIYKQLYNRNPTAEECNIRNYNNGSWGSKQELMGYIKNYNNSKTQKTPAGCDPWIVDIYRQLYGREPNADECNVRHYNNGSWGSKEELTGYIKSYKTPKIPISFSQVELPKLEGDPWIVEIYKQLYNREPNAWEINIQNYNNGSWADKNDLTNLIRNFQQSMRRQGVKFETAQLANGNFVVGFFVNGQQLAVDLLSPKGGQVVASGGANVIAAGGNNVVAPGGANVVAPGGGNVVSPGGGNVVSPGGGNVIAPGGGNVVAPGGANIAVINTMPGARFGERFGVNQSGRRVLTTSGRGALIIQ